MSEPTITVEHITDSVYCARAREQIARGKRNADWLSAHWPDLLPQARGKFVAVAGQEAVIADSAEEAWNWARAAHPEDDGAIVQFVRTEVGPRIYENRG